MVESSREGYNASKQAAMAIGSESSGNQKPLRFQAPMSVLPSNQNDEEDDDDEEVIDLSGYEVNRVSATVATNRPIKSETSPTRRPPATTSTLNRAGASVSKDLSGRRTQNNKRVQSSDEPGEIRRVASKSDTVPVIVYSLAGLSMIAGIVIVVVYLSNQAAIIDANRIASAETGGGSQANPQTPGAMNPGGQANNSAGEDAMFAVPTLQPRNAAPAPAQPAKSLLDQYRGLFDATISCHDSMAQTLRGVVDEKSANDANEHLAKLLDDLGKQAKTAEHLPDLGLLDDFRFSREIKTPFTRATNALLPELRRIRNNQQLHDAIIIDCDILIETLMEARKKLGIR